ncbi:PhoH family protein, partial [Vagococcus salmoninarum]
MEQTNVSLEIKLNSQDEAAQLLGTHDKHLKLIEENQHVTILTRGEIIQVTGSELPVQIVIDILKKLQQLILRKIPISTPDVVTALKMADKGTLEYFTDMYDGEIIKDKDGKSIRVKNYGQKQYVEMIKARDVTFGIGPAGTGKTFLAVVMAVAALKRGEVQKIVLTRPAVEAGESLGFLPGDLKEKVDPYLR